MQVKSPLYDTLFRLRKNDQEGFRRFIEAFDLEYRARLDDWIRAKPEDLAKFQGAALTYQGLLDLLKHILAAS